MATTSIKHFNDTLKRAEKRAWALEPRMVNVLTPILDQAGEEAADNFERMATDHLTASAVERDIYLLAAQDDPRSFGRSICLTAAADGVGRSSTMIAVKPRVDEAERVALPGGQDPASLHITLAFLGDYEGDLDVIANALVAVAGTHAPLEGKVGGVGQFEDMGKGHPLILLPSVPGLVELRVDVTNALQRASLDYGRDHGYQPHMTVDYSPDGLTDAQGAPYGEPLHFDSLLVVRGDTDVVEIPFTGSKPLTASVVLDLFGVGNEKVPIDWWLSILAAGEIPNWTAPAGSEIVDVQGLVASLRTKTDPVRMATVETTMKASLEGAGIEYDVTNPFTAKVLTQTGSQITEIGKTTQLNVMRIVKESYNQGLSIPDTAKAIRVGMTGEASTVRATLIARTELAGAVNGGSLAATQIFQDATGGAYNKQWLTSPGAQFPRHEDYDGLDGQTTVLEGFFDVGGDQLQFPGDPSGSPDEVCNCRCTMVYEDAHGADVGYADADSGGGDIPVADIGGEGDVAAVDAPEDVIAADQAAAAVPETMAVAPVEAPAPAVVSDLSAETAVASKIPPPQEREFGHYAHATLKTQIYRSKVQLRDLLVTQTQRSLTPDEAAILGKHTDRLSRLLEEKRFREAGVDRPFAHYKDVTLDTQIYRAKKTIRDVMATPIETRTQKEIDNFTAASEKLDGLLREQTLRKTETDLGGGRAAPKAKPGPTVAPPPTAPVAAPVSGRVGALRDAYLESPNRGYEQTGREGFLAQKHKIYNLTKNTESKFYAPEWEARTRALGQQFADEVEARMRAEGVTYDVDRARIVKDVIGEVRGVGYSDIGPDPFKVRPQSNQTAAKMAQHAGRFYPTDWIKLGRGEYRSGQLYSEDSILYKKQSGGGAYSTRDRSISTDVRWPTPEQDPNGFSTMIHEFAHRMEDTVPGIVQLEEQFFVRRTADSGLRPFRYRATVKVRPDEFVDEYMGRSYAPGDSRTGSSFYEVLSTGMQGIFAGHENLWFGDPDTRNFILGLLATV